MSELVQVAPKSLNSNWSPNIRDHFPFAVVRPAQEQGFQAIERAYRENKKFIIIEAPTGSGKCFAFGTRILMFDGTTKSVEDVVVGDVVMGDDSTPRKVLTLSCGTDEMYDVIPVKGDPYRVNSQHVLSLKVTKGVKTTGSGYHNVPSQVPFYRRNGVVPKAGLKIDIPLNEYLGVSKTQKHTLKGYRVGVSFSEQPLPLSPYFLGLWLGDGTSSGTGITTADEEVVNYIYNFATEQGLSVVVESKLNNQAHTYNLVTPRGKINPLLNILRGLGVSNNKHIPHLYLCNSAVQRLALLAGLIDSDGSLSQGSGFDFVFKSKQLAQGVTFLCRSLGMAAYLTPCKKTCMNNGKEGDYFRISVSGGDIMSYLPTHVKVERKRPTHRLQKKDVLVTGIKIESVGQGKYFGFEVDGNHRFLLADFTVVHNSGIAIAAGSHAKTQPVCPGFEAGSYILSPQKSLTQQYIGDFESRGLRELKGRSNYDCTRFVDEDGKPVDCEIGGMLCRTAKEAEEEGGEGSGCSYCPYKEAKIAFCKSPLGVTNFAYYLNETSHAGQLLPRKMLILDEGHNCESQILSLADIIINRYRCDEVGINFLSMPVVKPGQTTKGLEWVSDVFKPAANALIMVWESELEDLKTDGNHNAAAKLGKKLNGLRRFVGKLDIFTSSAVQNITDWIVYTDETKGSDSFGCMIIKPLTATLLADDILFSKAEKVVIMSATIGDFKFFTRNLGIDLKDAVTCRIDCDFPVENRPVFLKPIANMSSTKVGCPDCSTSEDAGRENRKGAGCRRCWQSGQVPSIDVAMPKVADFLDQIMKKFATYKGIVHTHSYKVNRFMSETLSEESRVRALTHTSAKGERDLVIGIHAESGEPTVLFSPSMTEGLDLKDELSRFSVIVKVPYPYLDPYVKARMQRDPDWYASLVALALVQATGRSNRHKEDKAKHFILDAAIINFLGRSSHLFPKWWLDAVVWPG